MNSIAKLIDYFVVCGLNPESGLEPDQLSGDSLHCPPLERPFKPHVLAHFASSHADQNFDQNAVCMLCHPRALRFQTQKDARQPRFHSFLITREDGTRTYGACLTFYEAIKDDEIIQAMHTLQTMHMAELSNTQSRTLYSHLPGGSMAVHHRSPKPHRRLDSRTIGRVFCKDSDVLYVTKSICVLSQICLVKTFEKILMALYSAVISNDGPDMSMESYIYNLLFEVPLPPMGRSLKFTCVSKTVVCQRPGISELPLLDFSLHELLELVGVENTISVFSSILLEHQVLLYSKDYQKLMTVAEGLTALTFPFQWPHVYVPILPTSVSHFLDAPVPFIMGLHHGTDSKALQEVSSKANMCFLDIDNGHTELPDDLPEFPHASQLCKDIKHELNRFARQSNPMNGHQRDSGFRESILVEDSGMSSAEGSASSSLWSIPGKLELLQQNEAMAKITALARKTGVIASLDDLRDSLSEDLPSGVQRSPQGGGVSPRTTPTTSPDEHVAVLLFNSAIREIFLYYFIQIFRSYESFVVNSSPDMESWLTNRETMQNFDRAAFLSDHAEAHLPFLSAFIETQMFTTFIDNKIIAQWEEMEPNLRVFEARLQSFMDSSQEQRVRRFYRSGAAKEAESSIERRGSTVDMIAPPPRAVEIANRKHARGMFPVLDSRVFQQDPFMSKSGKRDAVIRKKKGRSTEHSLLNSDQREKYIQDARTKSTGPSLTMTPGGAAQTNWKFVESLLKECKAKTKRMLVEKMGQEAVELGHSEATITGVEENALIASLCDLLERIWSHGRQNSTGKSALWGHLVSFQEVEQCREGNKPIDPNLLTPDVSSVGLEGGEQAPGTGVSSGQAQCPNGTQTWPLRRHRRKSSRGSGEITVFSPLPVSVLYDLKKVQQMSDIKTEVGCTRAFVRLALEKKLLSRHLKQLLSNNDLIKGSYKRYAFLRCEEEREQFLYHIMSLNAVDYYCFTSSFTSTVIEYQVLVFTRQKMSGGTTSANCWLSLAGSLGQTDCIPIPKNNMEMTIHNKNLGILTTLRIGHDNAGMSPKWMVEHILVRNQLTGHTYRFPCGRWLGKGVDDGALERLLVAEMVPSTADHAELMEKCRTPPRCRSPSMQRKSTEPKLQVSDIQEMLGDAVNNLVKHFYKPEKERGSLTVLLCGEYGLVYCMEHVFQCGFKSARFLRNRFFVWDFLEKVRDYFDNLLTDREHYDIAKDVKRTMQSYCYVIARINKASESIGKDGRFQIFICIGVRDRLLQRWVRLISKTPVTASMYEDHSFLRDAPLVQFLVQILDSLRDFKIVLEAALIKGVEL